MVVTIGNNIISLLTLGQIRISSVLIPQVSGLPSKKKNC